MVCCASVTTAGTAAKAWEAQKTVEIAARQESPRIDFDDDVAKAVFKDCI